MNIRVALLLRKAHKNVKSLLSLFESSHAKENVELLYEDEPEADKFVIADVRKNLHCYNVA